jgi:hypothetical protein
LTSGRNIVAFQDFRDALRRQAETSRPIGGYQRQNDALARNWRPSWERSGKRDRDRRPFRKMDLIFGNYDAILNPTTDFHNAILSQRAIASKFAQSIVKIG